MKAGSDRGFYLALGLLGGVYVLLIAALLIADIVSVPPDRILTTLQSPEIRSALWLSLLSSSITAILAVWTAVPLGYLLARVQFPGRVIVDLLVDVPIVLPPLVVGLSLLILFQSPIGEAIQRVCPVAYAVPGVILAQYTVATAFAIRTMRVTFEQVSSRAEDVARTLGCSRVQAFWRVGLPLAWRGVLTAFTLAWARALGEFGPVLIFAGVTRMKTEVLPTAIYLELSVGRVDAAVVVSLLMVAVALVVLLVIRAFGLREPIGIGRRST